MMESMANEVMKTHLPSYANFDSLTNTGCTITPLVFSRLVASAGLKFNNVVRDVLVNAQRKSEDCFDGSWDFRCQG